MLVAKIYDHFKIKNSYSDAIIQQSYSIFKTNFISVENLIQFIEDNIKSEETYNIEINTDENAITVKTVHGAKGLEWPIVFIVNCNDKQFPSTLPETEMITLGKTLGLRCSKQLNNKNNYTIIFDNWKTNLVKSVIQKNYDEERRLMYVAITRAKQYLYVTASKPSTFFKNLRLANNQEPAITTLNFDIEKQKIVEKDDSDNIKIGSYSSRKSVISAHDIMNYKKVYKQEDMGKGKDFGIKIHLTAEKIVKGIDFKDNSEESKRIQEFIGKIKCKELKPEIDILLELENCFVRGIIDLLVIYDDKIEIIDYKTDLSDLNQEEYVKQLSVYYHAVKEFYDKPTSIKIFYVSQNKIEHINPLSKKELESLAEDYLNSDVWNL